MKASDKYRNWFESDKLIADIMVDAANDIDERDDEIKRLTDTLGEIACLCLGQCVFNVKDRTKCVRYIARCALNKTKVTNE